MPDISILTVIKCIEFIIEGPTIRINLGFSISLKNSPNSPLAVFEATIAESKRWIFWFVAGSAHWADDVLEFLVDAHYAVAAIHDDCIVIGFAFLVQTQADPAETIL